MDDDWVLVEDAMAEWIDDAAEATRVLIQGALSESRRVETLLSENRTAYFGPARSCAPGALLFFHGTSWENAESIKRDGFIPSQAGCLGAGIYVGHCGKALRFARDASRHGGDEGGLVKVLVTIRNPKFVASDDSTWQAEGFDSCRADQTSASQHMEWCIADNSQVEVLEIVKIPIDETTSIGTPNVEEAALPPSQPLTLDALRQHEQVQQRAHTADRRNMSAEVHRRQFHCPKHGLFWRKVAIKDKQVARCRYCDADVKKRGQRGPAYLAIPREQERGRGDFECGECGKVWFSNHACRSLAQYCTRRGCPGGNTGCYARDITKPQPRERREDLEGIPEERPSGPPPPHRCSGCETGECRAPPPFSAVHESTGSTLPTLSVATFSELGDVVNAPVPWEQMAPRGGRRGRGGLGRGGRGGRGRSGGSARSLGSGSELGGSGQAAPWGGVAGVAFPEMYALAPMAHLVPSPPLPQQQQMQQMMAQHMHQQMVAENQRMHGTTDSFLLGR